MPKIRALICLSALFIIAAAAPVKTIASAAVCDPALADFANAVATAPLRVQVADWDYAVRQNNAGAVCAQFADAARHLLATDPSSSAVLLFAFRDLDSVCGYRSFGRIAKRVSQAMLSNLRDMALAPYPGDRHAGYVTTCELDAADPDRLLALQAQVPAAHRFDADEPLPLPLRPAPPLELEAAIASRIHRGDPRSMIAARSLIRDNVELLSAADPDALVSFAIASRYDLGNVSDAILGDLGSLDAAAARILFHPDCGARPGAAFDPGVVALQQHLRALRRLHNSCGRVDELLRKANGYFVAMAWAEFLKA